MCEKIKTDCAQLLLLIWVLAGHNVPLIKDNFDIRKLTPRECLLFQGFPQEYQIPNLSDSHIYKQAGNAVSVPVIRRIASNILYALDNKK